jgi:hypothetical protein
VHSWNCFQSCVSSSFSIIIAFVADLYLQSSSFRISFCISCFSSEVVYVSEAGLRFWYRSCFQKLVSEAVFCSEAVFVQKLFFVQKLVSLFRSCFCFYCNTQASAENWIDMLNEFQKDALSTRLGIPFFYGIDAVHGNNPVYKATIFPHNIGLGATRDP